MTPNETTLPEQPDRDVPRFEVAGSVPAGWRSPAARKLSAFAPIAQWGMVAIGGLYFVNSLSFLSSGTPYTEDQRFQIRTSAVSLLVLFGLIGWTAGLLLKGAAEAIEALTDQARGTERLAALAEERLAEALDRLVRTLERAPSARPDAEVRGPREKLLTEFHAALQAAQWRQAREHADAFAAAHPNDPEGARLVAAWDDARQAATHGLLARIDAARAVADPERVLDLRDLLVPLLDPEALRSLDKETARWCMGLIQKRLRTGTLGLDVAALAARMAESLDATTEGASLRAALPTLRRGAGLCARCGGPYTGIEDACPKCQAPSGAPTPEISFPDDPTPENGVAPKSEEDDWLLNSE